MLSETEVGQFRAFGFVVLRGCLSGEEVEGLQEAYKRVVADAPVYNYFGNNDSQVLTPFVQADDRFAALIEHPRIMEAMRDIWGVECLYIGSSDLWANRDDTPWHSDGRPGRRAVGIKTSIYLDEQDRDSGALNVIPGSHHPEFCEAIFKAYGYWATATSRPRLRIDPATVPGMVPLSTRPGDVVLWDTRLWHSAFRRGDGRPRRAMFISYVPDPQGDLLALSDLRAAVQAVLSNPRATAGPGDRFVYSREMMAKGGPAREKMAARLEALGVERVREGRDSSRPGV
jgi:hypothetical protein